MVTKRALSIGAATLLALSTSLVPVAQAKSKTALSETDVYALEMAESACANGEFKSLIQAMAISDAVVRKYSAPTINIVEGGTVTTLVRDAYHEFPIAMMDYYWISRASSQGEGEPEYLEMEFNQSQADQWAVDWQIVKYDGNSEGGDDLGKVIERIGEPGVLNFEPFDGCWRLTDDYRGEY